MERLHSLLRELPDDWGSWLVLADALTEAGDGRGALLVAEHQGESVHGAALAWVDSWRAYLADQDVDTFIWLARFASVARRAPPDLAPTFAQPVSQLLALVDLADDPSPRLSHVFKLQRDRILAATLTWIDRAFDGVPAPDAEHFTIHQAEAADGHAYCDQSRDHKGRWQALPEAHLLENQWALAHLDEQGIHYYVPAVMTYALRHFQHPDVHEDWITESLAYQLSPSTGELRDYQQRRFSRFDHEQRAAIYAYVLVTGTDDARAAWRAVLEYERGGTQADWYAIYARRPRIAAP
jgi:hypothetical protein